MNISSPWLRSYLSGEISEPLVISTTGSGGVIKNVTIPASALIASANAAHKFLGAIDGDSWSLLLPTNHIAGVNVLARSIQLGTELKSMAQVAEFTSIVPTQLHQALNGDDLLLKHLQGCKAVLVGGARLPDNLLEQSKNSGINVVTTYGATETCGGCVYNGLPLEGVRVRIVDGLIEIKIDNLNSGQWIVTNDMGELVDGKLLVLGRADDVIISGGENISLLRLEKVLEENFPNQIFVALAIKDEKWGEALAVISNSEFPNNLEDVITKTLGKLYLPKHRKVVANIPMIGIGKYDRKAATQLF